MPYVIRRFKVEDFAQAKRAWNESAGLRSSQGVRSEQLFRNPDDPQDALALYEYDSLDQARQHDQAPQIQEARQRGGVTVLATYFPEA
jgi:hypothetical protein